MGETDMTLDKLPVGQTRRIAAVGGQGALRRVCPIELRLRGYELTLRLDDAREIALEAPDGEAE